MADAWYRRSRHGLVLPTGKLLLDLVHDTLFLMVLSLGIIANTSCSRSYICMSLFISLAAWQLLLNFLFQSLLPPPTLTIILRLQIHII